MLSSAYQRRSIGSSVSSVCTKSVPRITFKGLLSRNYISAKKSATLWLIRLIVLWDWTRWVVICPCDIWSPTEGVPGIVSVTGRNRFPRGCVARLAAWRRWWTIPQRRAPLSQPIRQTKELSRTVHTSPSESGPSSCLLKLWLAAAVAHTQRYHHNNFLHFLSPFSS